MLRLELVDISKQYPGVRANDHVDLQVEAGQIHAVLGENGAGKSTLMKVIYGVTAPDSGEIRWNGRPVGAAISRAVPLFCAAILAIRMGAAIMHVPMSRGIVPWFTVTPGNLDRARIVNFLQSQPGGQLVVVKYRPTHFQSEEWVYNEPDIDAAKIVWARDSGSENNAEILQYFRQRRIWLLEPDEKPPHLVPVASP